MSDPAHTELRTFTLEEALEALRARATADPGSWTGAESERSAVTLEWIVRPPDLDTQEAMRVTRRFVPPVADDLERFASAIPRALEVGPIVADAPTRSFTLGLRPASGRRSAERCDRCGARPRFGTRLYGDAQRCAICSLWGEDERVGNDRGSTLIGVLLLILLLAMIVGGAMTSLQSSERARGARGQVSQLEAAGRSTLDVMTERLRAVASLRLGSIDAADLVALNAAVASLPAHTGITLDGAETGFRIVAVREQDVIPDDAELLDVWTDQPRVRYDALPRPQGLTAARTVEVEMRVLVRGAGGSRRTMTRTAAISRLPAFPHALYTRTVQTEFCAPAGGASIGGEVRVDGQAHFPVCAGMVAITGSLEARDGTRNDDPRNHLLTDEGSITIPTWSRAAAETGSTALLAATSGRVRIPAAAGGTYEDGRAQTAGVAGTGECVDFTAACSGNGYFGPSIVLQRTSTGPSPAASVTCGHAYANGTACQSITAPAIRYRPWPWTDPVPAGVALPDPSSPGRLWRGLLFDPRRETHCTATVATNIYPTHRCPSNTFGWLLDLALLGPVRGGLVHFRAAVTDPPGRAAAGAQEALVIRNAERLTSPLTIVSEIPVFIIGNLNTVYSPTWRGPPPMMIDAPRITLLPAEADVQLGLAPGAGGWASVWDVVPPAGSTTASALPLIAASNVNVFAVLRTRICGRSGGVYQGGAIDQAPATLGDWTAAEVRLVGAVEQYEEFGLTAVQCRWWGMGYGSAADGSPWRVPGSRTILYDPRLAHPSFSVPGSYMPVNLPPGGVPGAARRTAARQERATGGYGVMRLTQETGRRQPRSAVPLPTAAPLPPAPPALPR